MSTKKILCCWLMPVILFSLIACSEEDLGPVDKASVLRFEFPQGNNAWDAEIQEIAREWGMYIIYKDIDTLALNRSWTTPADPASAYKGDPVPEEYIPVYLDVIKNNMLAFLDKNNESHRKQLPIYFILLNNYHNSYGSTMQINMNGFDYWVLSFTDEELESGLAPKTKHKIACTFGYLPILSAFQDGSITVPEEFISLTDYETRIGIALDDQPFLCNRDPVNLYYRRGFLHQTSEDFELKDYGGGYYCPEWMPWIQGWILNDMPVERNYYYEQDVDKRPEHDFLNYIRYAMMFSTEQIEADFPADAVEPLEKAGNELILKKYHIVIDYMESLGYRLTDFAGILTQGGTGK